MRRRKVFSAGASHYGVADLQLLAAETHKFESRYLDGLIGSWPKDRELYKERSPINSLDKFDSPVAFFQARLPPAAPCCLCALFNRTSFRHRTISVSQYSRVAWCFVSGSMRASPFDPTGLHCCLYGTDDEEGMAAAAALSCCACAHCTCK